MLLYEALDRILAQLKEHGTKSALLGGLAVSAWTEPRFTRDVDLAVAVRTDSEAEDLVRSLGRQGYRLLATVEQTAAGRMATARLSSPDESDEGMIVDLLFASSGIEPEVVRAAVALDIGAGSPVRVARAGHLVALKLLAYDPATRPQDALDLNVLRATLDPVETRRAHEACELIMQRGYARGRDLSTLLRNYLSEHSTD